MIALAGSAAALIVVGLRLGRIGAAADESRATTLVRGALAAFAALIVVEATLGAAGLLAPWGTTAALIALAEATDRFAARRARAVASRRPPLTPLESALVAGLVAALLLRLRAGTVRTTFLYDTLSYHLHEPVSWMHAHRLTIVPAVFGDPAPGYAPANLELWFLFLMAPLRSDYLAGVGQLPFAALAAAAIAAAVREGGGNRTAAAAAALAFLLVPEVWQQAPSAMVDLGLAALLLASLPFALRGELPPAAAALGLAIGTKYVGLPLALPFALLAIGIAARRPAALTRRRALLSVAILIATGGFWYLRNLVVAGNPIYPGAVPGLPVAALYDGAAMRGWDYHVPIGDLGALAEMLSAAGVGFTAAALLALARSPRAPELPLAAGLVLLFWLAIPYQESRFLFAAFGVAAIAIGRAAARAPGLVGGVALVSAIAGSLLQFPTPERLALVPIAGLGALWPALQRRLRPTRLPVLAGAAAAVLIVTGAIGLREYRGRDRAYDVGDDDLASAWRWFRGNVHDAHVAYAGTNLAFPLAGEGLTNQVAYVNVAGAPDARLHDFAPGARPGGNPEPAPYRDGATFDVWWRNLGAAKTDVLFVAAEAPIVRRTIAADGDGFPVERAWADAHPDRFTLRFASAAARVYAVAR